MRSNPSAAWDKTPRNIYNLGTEAALKRAPKTDAIGKRTAHAGNVMCRKARRNTKKWEVDPRRVKVSNITWA
jgi:hypothetical protein